MYLCPIKIGAVINGRRNIPERGVPPSWLMAGFQQDINHSIKRKTMLYYGFQNYEAFNRSFGMVRHGNGVCSRKNKVLLAYIKDKGRLHEAARSNCYDSLRLTDMAGLEAAVENEILKSGSEDGNLPYTLRLMGRIYHSALYETDENEGLCEDGDLKSFSDRNGKS